VKICVLGAYCHRRMHVVGAFSKDTGQYLHPADGHRCAESKYDIAVMECVGEWSGDVWLVTQSMAVTENGDYGDPSFEMLLHGAYCTQRAAEEVVAQRTGKWVKPRPPLVITRYTLGPPGLALFGMNNAIPD